MEKESAYAIISDLILLAHADAKVTTSEYDFILQLAQRMDVSKIEVDLLFAKPKPSKPLLSEIERISHFYKLVLLMNVDMETHEDEITIIRNFGLKMGIRPGVFDQLLFQMNNYENKIVPSDELIKIFKSYYN